MRKFKPQSNRDSSEPLLYHSENFLSLLRRQTKLLAELPHLPEKIGQGAKHLCGYFIGMPNENEPINRRMKLLNAWFRYRHVRDPAQNSESDRAGTDRLAENGGLELFHRVFGERDDMVVEAHAESLPRHVGKYAVVSHRTQALLNS